MLFNDPLAMGEEKLSIDLCTFLQLSVYYVFLKLITPVNGKIKLQESISVKLAVELSNSTAS